MRRKLLTLLALLLLVAVTLGSNCDKNKITNPLGEEIDSVNPSHGCPGDTVTVNGVGFTAASIIVFDLNGGTSSAQATIKSYTTTTATIRVPNLPPGTYKIRPADGSHGPSFTIDNCNATPTPSPTATPTPGGPTSTPTPTSAAATATATPTPTTGPPSSTPTPTPVGAPSVTSTDDSNVGDNDLFDIFGSGLGNCSQVTVTLEDGSGHVYALTCIIGDDLSVQVKVPPGIPPGTYHICVTRGGLKGCSTFTITKH
jgi:hypothetical protein